jgi:hypothetical protein
MSQLSRVCATLSLLLLLLSVPARAADTAAAAPASTGAATSAPAASAATAALPSPAAAQPLASGTPEVAAPATQPFAPPPTFDATAPEEEAVNFKIYGDTQFRVQNHAAVHDSFATAHIDLFPTADVGKLSFLSEIFFEAGDSNEFSVDIERLQIAYLFSNWLRVRAGRTHTAFGYYNDTYHHGNLFELTTDRPYAVNFEDEGGLIGAHLVGVGVDGTFDTSAGSFRYDLETGNGRLADVTAVAVDHAEKDDKLVNLRLRWLPIDGLILGVNGLHDEFPAAAATAVDPARPKLDELIGGAHAVYMEHDLHILLETYLMVHKASGGNARKTSGGFAELGYAIGEVTPYGRLEYISFPKLGDLVFQEPSSPYVGTQHLFDARLGIRFQPLPALALKLEVQRVAFDSSNQESATVKAAFGF